MQGHKTDLSPLRRAADTSGAQSSDQDDWTLITPPTSKSVSPKPVVSFLVPASTSTSAGDNLGDNASDACDVVDDDDDDANDGDRSSGPNESIQSESTISSSSQSDTGDCDKRSESQLVRRKVLRNHQHLHHHQGHTSAEAAREHHQSKAAPRFVQTDEPDTPVVDSIRQGLMNLRVLVAVAVVVTLPLLLILKKDSPTSEDVFNQLYLDPSDHAFSELKYLDSEIFDCIKRENPHFEKTFSFFGLIEAKLNKGVRRGEASKSHSSPLMGLVCYEFGREWLKKLDKIKTDYNYDLLKTVKRAQNQITYEMLERINPTLRFRFILNQIDFIQNHEQRRTRRELDRLRAENQELKRRINSLTDRESSAAATRASAKMSGTENGGRQHRGAAHEQQHGAEHRQAPGMDATLVASLQGENRRLKVANEMLKQSLGEKAGTVYIRQSIELEKCERDNNAMRQFHQQVAAEVSKGLGQLNVPINDFGIILNEHDESLNARLNQTRVHLARLVEETGKLALKNKTIQAELSESRLLHAMIAREAQTLAEGDPSEANATGIAEMLDSVHGQILNKETLPAAGNTEPREHCPYSDGPYTTYGETVRSPDGVKCETYNERLSTDRAIVSLANKVNWLIKRAKLREKLRKSQKARVVGGLPRDKPAANFPFRSG